MKKSILLSLLALLISSLSFSQITILETDIATIGANYEQRADTLPSVAPGTAGPSQVWNFSGLASHDTTFYIVENPSDVPFGYRFPNANLALHENNSPNSYFFSKSAIGLASHGVATDYMGTGDTICIIFNDPDTMLTLPSAYNESFVTFVNGDSKSRVHIVIDTVIMATPVSVPVDSVRILHHAIKSSVMDAWGDLILPGGTFPALRQQTYETSIDSIYAYVNYPPFMQGWMYYQSFSDTSNQFNWWVKSTGIAVVNMEYDSTAGMATHVDWINIDDFGMNPVTAGSDFQIYPNPAHGQVFCSATPGNELTLYNNLGQAVLRTTVTGPQQMIDVSSLPAGIYILQQTGTAERSTERIILE